MTARTAQPLVVFKVLEGSEWRHACRSGWFLGSADDRRDGFIHLSARHQLGGTLARHFAGKTGHLLVAYAAEDLGRALRWEPSRGGELFPHLYGPLPTAPALWTKPLPLGDDGVPMLPADLA